MHIVSPKAFQRGDDFVSPKGFFSEGTTFVSPKGFFSEGTTFVSPKGFSEDSPGLSRSDYPGEKERDSRINPERVARVAPPFRNPVGVYSYFRPFSPRVAASGNPGLSYYKPFGLDDHCVLRAIPSIHKAKAAGHSPWLASVRENYQQDELRRPLDAGS